MRFDPGAFVGPIVAALLLVLIVQQTESALSASGAWMRTMPTANTESDRYARLEHALAQRDTSGLRRDPFAHERAVGPIAVHHAAVHTSTTPPVAQPVLTAIVWDADPRATVRWNGRDYSVHVNSLFDDFRVRSISQTEVVLEHGSEAIVLQLTRKGE